MKKHKLWLTGFSEITLFTLILINFNLIGYGLSQLNGQLSIIMNTRPIEKVLKDSTFPDSLKTKLVLIPEMKNYAVDSIGINPSKNYTKVYDQKGQDILWILTACEPYELKAYEWTFPVLGAVEYKGFFDLVRGKKEEKKILNMGLDGGLSKVGAWSTLGFFKDPILSNMLTYDIGDLANLIIHELTHGTLFVKGDVEFNENLASFIGDQGALRFLKQKYGPESPELREYLETRHDEQVYAEYILKSAKRLDSLYAKIKSESIEVKEKHKTNMLNEIAKGANELPIYRIDRYQKSIQKIHSHKNAYFMSFIRYGAKQEQFETEMKEKFNGDLKLYFEHLKKLYPSI
jgi:predicted aminopeptidase